ncbi:putative nucleoside diphosphate kinase [Phytophthora cinnamomi]|uniref:putative nucleoside diphosphate kinase n=1 Tax=Phytophthora cinnamomi TaxID=4785 RepID=UPI0035595712|nr:putative nucleoside diphosphate kinase [Phytophthora cinnamomi]
MARLYLAGYNDPESPLKLRTTVPPSLKKVLYDVEFKNLADRINRVLAWQRGPCSSWGKIVYFLVALLCYPFASEVELFRRHIRVNELKRIVAKYNHACMKGPRARGLLNAVKLGYCADYSLVYLELLYKESSQSVCVPTTKIGKPSLPLVLLFAGCGTYFSPFYLDPNDLLVRSIPQCPELTAFIDEPWIEFVAELNELLRVVQRDEASLVESLIPVAVYLEKQRALAALGTNSSKLGGLRIYLGRFYVQDELDMGEEFKLGLFLTTADESMDNVSSNNNIQQAHQQAPPSSNRYGYGSHYSKDTNYYNINDVYGYGRGDSLDYPGPRRSNGSFGNADGLLYDMGGWGTALTNSNSSRGRSRSSNGPVSGNGATQNPVSSIREEALRIRSSSSHGDGLASHSGRGGNSDDVLVLMASGSSKKKRHNSAAHHTFYEGWLGPVDASLPVPGVLICADELRERLADRAPRQMLKSFLQFHLLPRNLPRSSSLNLAWMLSISLLTLLMVDLAITFAILANLKCVTNGEVDHDCSASIMVPVLLVPPLALVVSPIMGIVSLALSSSTFTRRFSVWNALSMISVGIAILACIAQSSRLVAPWFAGPLPLLPVFAMGIKAGQAYVVERYIAFQETKRRRRGWRGIMKRRLSDASIPTESPYSSPAPGRAEFRLTSTPPIRDDQGFNLYGGYN